jgi:outer membrane protein TolC
MRRIRCVRGARAAAILVLSLSAMLLPGLVHGQAGEPLTVEEAVRMALEQNAGLRAARADASAAGDVYRQARAAQLPALRAQASYTRLGSNIPDVEFTVPGLDTVFTFQAAQLDRTYTEVSVEQPLLGQLRLRHETRAARHEVTAAEQTLEQERVDVAFEVRRAYWTLHRSIAVLATTDAAIAQVEQHLTEVRARVAEGAALRRDLLAAQTRRSEVQLERVEAGNAVRVAQLELNRLIGLPLDSPVQPATPVEAAAGEPLPATVAGPESRPQIAALTEQVRALDEQLRATRASRLPELDFFSRYVHARPNTYFFSEPDRFRGTWELGLAARWDVWEGGRNTARAGESRSRLEAAEARLADARERAAVEITRRRLEVQRATEAVEVAGRNVAEAEESFRVARQQYAEGVATSADVLDAEQALRRGQARRAEALSDQAIARAAVLNATGRVW